MGRSLSEQYDSIHTKIWNYFLTYFFLYLVVCLFVFFCYNFKPYKFLIDFQIRIHASFIHIVLTFYLGVLERSFDSYRFECLYLLLNVLASQLKKEVETELNCFSSVLLSSSMQSIR